MLLLSWHGTLVCLRRHGGGLVQMPVGAVDQDAVPLELDLDAAKVAAGGRVQSVLGELSVTPGLEQRTISLARYGQILCAGPDRSELDFNRDEVNIWESFLPVAQRDMDVLAELADGLWLDRATRQVVRRGSIRLAEGFRLTFPEGQLDLGTGWPLRLGPEDAPAAGFTLDLDERQLELVPAEPRSSALLDTRPWPPRARRVAEIITLAAHRQVVGREPEQDAFEQDVAFLLEQGGPPGLERLLERLLAGAEPRQVANDPDVVTTTAGPESDDVLLGWAMRHAASWAPGSVDPNQALTAFAAMNRAESGIYVFRISRGLVSMDEKPNAAAPSTLQTQRAFAYLQFLQGVAARLPEALTTTLCVCVDDTREDTDELPVFRGHKRRGGRALLLPDAGLLAADFLEGAEVAEPGDYTEKARSAVFSGATLGGVITPEVARARGLPRLRMAAVFNGHDKVDVRLPEIVGCEGDAEQILRAEAFCQKPAMSWEEQLRHRMLIQIDGDGPDGARLAASLLARSVPLVYESPDELYYSAALQPWLHVIPVSADADIETILAIEAEDPEAFARIAEHGSVFAEAYLSRDAAERYVALLLQRYARIMAPVEAGTGQTQPVRAMSSSAAAGRRNTAQDVADATLEFEQARPDSIARAGSSDTLKDQANAALAAFCRSAGLQETFRFAFQHRAAGGADVEVAVVALDSFGAGTVVHIDLAHDDPWIHMLRATSLIYILEAMLSWAPVESGQLMAELGDVGWRDGGASFCSSNPKSLLLPDSDFIGTGGYAEPRRMVAELNIAWEARRPVVFWRGSTTGRRSGSPPPDDVPDDFRWLPRLRLCHLARISPHARHYDVGIAMLVEPDVHRLRDRLEAADLMRPPVSRDAFLDCKAILVIDGNSNAWSALFCALLSGACVLKVESEAGYRQWYHDDLKPWVHYVPVRSDLADMDDAVAWVMANDDDARQIGAAGKALADAMTFESVVADAARRLRKWIER